MSKKVYVGNLPFSVDSEKLKELFASYGEIEEATVITDRFSGRSKGFGFVTIDDDEAAKKAIEEFNGKKDQFSIIHTQDKILPKRMFVIGLGKEKDVAVERVRRAMSLMINKAKELS